MKFEYGFYPYGTTKKPQDIPQNEIWVDIGGHLEGRIFDHHQQTDNECISSAFSAVIQYINRLENIRQNQEIDVIRICTHMFPDVDALCAIYAIQYFLLNGKKAFDSLFGSNGKAIAFQEYINKIDCGKGKIVSTPTLYAIACSLEKGFTDVEKNEVSLRILNKGLKLFETVIDIYLTTGGFDLFTEDLSNHAFIRQQFSNEIEYINACKTKYEQEERPNISVEKIRMMNRDGNIIEVKAAIWKKKILYDFSYIYAREKEHCDLTVVPYSIKGDGDDKVTRVIVSLRPDYEEQVSLLPIAEIFEQLEQIEEERIVKETGQYRRNYGHSRTESADELLSLEPFCTTADPWYISKEEDIIDAPGICSILNYDTLVDVIRNSSNLIKRSYYVSYKVSMNTNNCNTNVTDCTKIPDLQSTSKWIKNMQIYLDKPDKDFSLIIAEMSSSLVAHNNLILEAFCKNLIGKGFHDITTMPFYHPDYKTCLYANPSCGVLLVASSSDADYEHRNISKLLDLTNTSTVKSSPFILCFQKLIHQRMQLFSFNKKIEHFSNLKRKEIEHLNRDLVKYIADTQANDIIENPTEQCIHDYAKAALRLDTLSNSIISSLNVVINDARDNYVHKFNLLSALAIPFILLSTFFQVGVLDFVPIIEIHSKYVAAIAWVVILLFSAFISLLLAHNWNSKKNEKG